MMRRVWTGPGSPFQYRFADPVPEYRALAVECRKDISYRCSVHGRSFLESGARLSPWSCGGLGVAESSLPASGASRDIDKLTSILLF